MSIEITGKLVNLAVGEFNAAGGVSLGQHASMRAALTAVLSLPEVRDAIYADVRREIEASLKAAGVTGYTVEGI